jgi:hypothetical protein
MREAESRKYVKMNELAEQGGIVIFGCGEDKDIPTCELRQAFAVETKVYNRSFNRLSVKGALDAYEETVAPIVPETVLLHLGEDDKAFFEEDPGEFDHQYRRLIGAIKAQDKKCRVAVVSLKNYGNDPQTEEINKHLKYIAESEQCTYGDISEKKVWNPKASMDTASFVYSAGFVHSLKNQRPIFDLVKMFFCCEC